MTWLNPNIQNSQQLDKQANTFSEGADANEYQVTQICVTSQ